MSLSLKPLHPVFGAEASGVDLTKRLTPEEVSAINLAMNRYAVLVFRGQCLTAEQQLNFTQHFGQLDIGLKRIVKRHSRLGDERLIDISNINAEGQVEPRDSPRNLSNFANQLWHSDSSFMKPRAAYSVLHCLVKTSWGGDTQFADLRHAYDLLDERTRQDVQGLSAEHYAVHSRLLLGAEAYTDGQGEKLEPVTWPLVDTHSGSGRKVLFVGAHARKIIGWPTAESRLFLLDLLEHATRHEHVYAHQWQPGDTVIWDNRSTLHRGRRYDITERREMRRTTINDDEFANLS
jgi:alpha-ketoglutarate-dependent 2,4-dichlorophenoxyacetate dioxygenase